MGVMQYGWILNNSRRRDSWGCKLVKREGLSVRMDLQNSYAVDVE